MPVIYVDTRQQKGKHEEKHGWLLSHGVSLERATLRTGDYRTGCSNVLVDTKAHMDELAANLTRDHARFARECDRASEAGCRLVILVEEDVEPWEWTNGRCRTCKYRVRLCCHPRQRGEACGRYGTAKPTQGNTISKTMASMSAKHGVIFDFCDKSETGRKICEWLGVDYDRGDE
ncbi:MAG: hypothetical protein IKF14_05140 [Atopobiaceae bacterium]|nr:hypothetical protein [Atopobiaceae bacterium]MBR3158474.1 hypothetical protein [Atopobiaceae bacterium]